MTYKYESIEHFKNLNKDFLPKEGGIIECLNGERFSWSPWEIKKLANGSIVMTNNITGVTK